MTNTQTSKVIKASQEKLFEAFCSSRILEKWLVPGDMTGKINRFDFRVNGGYQMSLFYPETDNDAKGKSSEREDRYNAKYLEIIPNKKIVQAVKFETNDPAFAEEMILEVCFEKRENGTELIMVFKNLPLGINPEDNEKGTKSSLEKLAKLVE